MSQQRVTTWESNNHLSLLWTVVPLAKTARVFASSERSMREKLWTALNELRLVVIITVTSVHHLNISSVMVSVWEAVFLWAFWKYTWILHTQSLIFNLKLNLPRPLILKCLSSSSEKLCCWLCTSSYCIINTHGSLVYWWAASCLIVLLHEV